MIRNSQNTTHRKLDPFLRPVDSPFSRFHYDPDGKIVPKTDEATLMGQVNPRVNTLLPGKNIITGPHADVRTYAVVVRPGDTKYSTIKNALSEVSRLGGGKIYVTAGTYVMTSVGTISTNNTEIIGENRETTVFQVGSAANIGGIFDIQADNVILHDFTLDGNKANQTGGTQFLVNFTTGGFQNLTIERVNFINQYQAASGDCLSITNNNVYVSNCFFGTADGAAVDCGGTNCTFISCRVQSAGWGFLLDANNRALGCSVGTVTNEGFRCDAHGASIVGCEANGCGLAGIEILGDKNTVSSCVVTNCGTSGNEPSITITTGDFDTIQGCAVQTPVGTAIGMLVFSNTFNVIQGCTVDLNAQTSKDGIAVYNASRCNISNNLIRFNGLGTITDNAYSGILLFATSTRNVISGNGIRGDLGTLNLAYGIRENGTTDDVNLIHGNIIRGCGTNVGTQGANTVSADNILGV